MIADQRDAGVRFLLARQSPEGWWSDWSLPPGESRMWTTAYVGYRLSALSTGTIGVPLTRAAGWLARAALDDGGWGFSDQVGSDADSTALAILFLTAQGQEVPPRAYERLCAFQRADGGFATFTTEQSFGEWTASHADVSGIAIAALRTRFGRDDERVARAISYARAQANAAGTWSSYWWSTPLYATEANLRWLVHERGHWPLHAVRESLADVRPTCSFETALLLMSLIQAGCATDSTEVRPALEGLLAAQDSDGSWPSVPVLRLPDRNAGAPLPAATPLFADEGRTFSTSTALAALAAFG